MKIAVLNYQTGRADILENVPDEGELRTYFIEHPIQGAMHKLGQNDDSICFIEAYLEVTCGYHMSEIDWMVINDVNFTDMRNIF